MHADAVAEQRTRTGRFAVVEPGGERGGGFLDGAFCMVVCVMTEI